MKVGELWQCQKKKLEVSSGSSAMIVLLSKLLEL